MSHTGAIERFGLFIDGKPVDSVSGRTFGSLNPYTGEPWAVVADGTPEDVDSRVSGGRCPASTGQR